ncbi:hypothetical protein ABDK96_02665 [Citricoccus nitrophenolicus]|uniref:Uncharacterized protein n=1 Tax=Citricoccus nitrophenolicus TaxID=863575 RepID=A0ABV0IFY0_9MICC|nr:hypothetical protein [Citricoccus sp. I39-566]WMY77033.1 hypothetical protein RE421_09095 [Citricoccus sp. I39-566]
MDGEDLKHLLREAFDSRVINHGDFNLVYGQPSGAGNPWTIGYRRQPLELLLCPVHLEALPEVRDELAIATVALGNVATLADTGTGYQVETVTGFRTWFEVTGTPRVPLTENLRSLMAGERHGEDGTLVIEQERDAEDFHQFMSHFMDTLDSYYEE